MLKKIIYTIIYFFLANSLYWSFAGMASISMGEVSRGRNPILEIVFVGVCVLFCMLTHKKTKMPPNGTWLKTFIYYILFISIFHGILIGFQRTIAVFFYVQPVLLFFVEYFAQQDEDARKLTPYYVKALACWIVYLFITNYQKVELSTMESFNTTNSSYYLLYFLPMLFLNIKEKHRYFVFLITLVVVLLSSKRAGLIALVLGFLSYSYAKGKVDSKKGIIRTVLLILLFYFVLNWMNTVMDNRIFDRFSFISDDDGSGRLDVWMMVWSLVQRSDFFNLMFGHGFGSVAKEAGMGLSAHNDFLEVLYDFDWVGLLLFVAFLVSWFGYAVRLIKSSSRLAPIVMMALFIFVTNCFFSHIVIYTQCFNLFTLFFGAVLGIEKREALFDNN